MVSKIDLANDVHLIHMELLPPMRNYSDKTPGNR